MAERAWPDPLRGEDAHRSPHGRLRLPELQYSTLSNPANRTDRMETLNHTEQRSGQGQTEEAQRPMGNLGRGQRTVRSGKHQPEYAEMGNVLTQSLSVGNHV